MITFGSVYKWMIIVERLAQGDITKFDAVYKQNFIGCLNLLSYWKDRDKELERMRKENERQNR